MGESSEIADIYEDFMKYGTTDNQEDLRLKEKGTENKEKEEGLKEFKVPVNQDVLASIAEVKVSKDKMKTFEDLEVEVTYDIYKESIDGFLLGVALYTPNREYIFGPNTFLDKAKVPNTFGRHKVIYKIPKMSLLGGVYTVDVGIFTHESIVQLDYKQEVAEFTIQNKYISEGKFYIQHEWNVIE